MLLLRSVIRRGGDSITLALLAAALVLALGALLLTPGAVGGPNTPGDPTPPQVTPVILGTLGTNGWYTTNVTLNWTRIDPESVILSESGCDAKTITSDTTGATFTCSASSDGGTTTVTKTIKVDMTSPSATATPSRSADANGWYNHALTVSFAGSDVTSGIASCSSASYSGPDSGNAAVGGSCTDKAGNVGKASLPLKYDATPPVTAAAASRAADANGWYNHALTVSFAGSDVTSGIASCSSASYSGPDNASASVAGSCTDNAGNVGAASQPLKYDSTPPTVSRLAAAPGNRRFELKWSSSSDTENIQVARSPGRGRAQTSTVYSGRARSCRDAGLSVGKAYRYTVTGFDQAGNTGSATVTVKATGPLLSPPPGARVTSPPVLTWTPVARASYYNIQIVRGKKILSIWPRRPYFRLPRSWSFDGHPYRLEDGVYHWYVWPGFGRLSVAKYGNRLGGSTFVVGQHTRAAR